MARVREFSRYDHFNSNNQFIFTFLRFFLRLMNWKINYLNKSPYQKWAYVFEIHRWLGSCIGCDFMDSYYKVSLNTWLPAIILADYFILMVYTLWYFRHDMFRGLMATPANGLIFPVSYMHDK